MIGKIKTSPEKIVCISKIEVQNKKYRKKQKSITILVGLGKQLVSKPDDKVAWSINSNIEHNICLFIVKD